MTDERKRHPRILTISSTIPGSNGVGAIILRDLCQMYFREALSGYFISSKINESNLSTQLPGLPLRLGEDCKWKIGGNRASRLFRWPLQYLKNRWHINKLINDAAELAREQSVDLVWVVLDAPGSIAIGRRVAKKTGKPFVAMVWDDVEHNLSYFGVYRIFRHQLLREFDRTLRQSLRCAVIGESMKRHYDKTYGTNAIILRHGVSQPLVRQPATAASTKGPIRIGFIGSVTAASAFKSFISALDRSSWRIAGREVHLKLAGHRFDLRCQNPANIEYLGWRSLEESINQLCECDVNYLPQPFESHLRALAELSFPTKLTSYLAAGRPVLLHCPDYGSLHEFFRENPFGVWVDSLDPDILVASLERFFADQNLYKESVEAGQSALAREFSQSSFREAFQQFIGGKQIRESDSMEQSLAATRMSSI